MSILINLVTLLLVIYLIIQYRKDQKIGLGLMAIRAAERTENEARVARHMQAHPECLSYREAVKAVRNEM